MYKVRKRNGKIVNFEIRKISEAMKKAFDASEKTYDDDVIDFLALKVTADFEKNVKDNIIDVEGNLLLKKDWGGDFGTIVDIYVIDVNNHEYDAV